MALPAPGPFTNGVLTSASPWTTASPSSDLTNYISALGSMFDTVASLLQESGDPSSPATYTPSWSTLLNVQTCPTQFLPYLAQFVGASVPPGTDDATARNTIQMLPAQHRGTPAAIVAAAQSQLAAPQTVTLFERQNSIGGVDAYRAVLIVFQNQLLTTLQAVRTAVELVKPAGIQFTYIATSGFLWSQAINSWQQDTMSWQQTLSIQP